MVVSTGATVPLPSVTAVLAPLGDQVQVHDRLDKLVAAVVRAARPGDHILCMSNGGFGGVHDKLLAALAARHLGR